MRLQTSYGSEVCDVYEPLKQEREVLITLERRLSTFLVIVSGDANSKLCNGSIDPLSNRFKGRRQAIFVRLWAILNDWSPSTELCQVYALPL